MANFFQASKKKQTLGQVFDITIERVDLNGCGVARLNNKPVFIEQTLPGEVVKAKIVEQKSKYSRAKIIEISQPSPQRVKPLCEHFRSCGGCDLQHWSFSEHLAFKQEKVMNLFQRNQVEQPLPWQNAIVSEPWYYRRKARIGVQYDKHNKAVLGFRQKSTNQLTTIKKCHVLVEEVSTIFTLLKDIVNQLSLSRSVGHIEIIVTEQVNLVIRQLKNLNDKDRALWESAEQLNRWQVFIDDGEQVQPLTKVKPLTYALSNNIELSFKTTDFIQINHRVNVSMVEQALNWLSLKPTDIVLDLFCGLGNFSLSLAQKVKQVVGVEGVQNMVERATINAQANQLTNCRFYQTDLNADWSKQTWSQEKFNKVLLDPARAGALEAIEQLVQLSVKHILYVSCDPSTLARDAKQLISHGYKIEKIALIDMFSQTKHVETMVLFSR